MAKIKKVKNGSSIKLVKKNGHKESKVKLLTYTLRAVIPTGQYANIQPEVTVQAETIEQAERFVMPYIETLFAKYKDGGVRNIEPVRPVVAQKAPVAPQPTAASVPVAPAPKQAQQPVQAAPAPVSAPKPVPVAPVAAPVAAPAPAAPAAIVMTVPFTRAKTAIETCTSAAALKLISDQLTASTKLTDSEKVTLREILGTKQNQINGRAA